MKKNILVFMMLISSPVYAEEEKIAYLYEKNKQALFLGGCNRGVFPFNSIDFSKIKDLTLKYKLEKIHRNHQEPTSFIFLIENKEITMYGGGDEVVSKLCNMEKPREIEINYYKIEGSKRIYYYIDEI
ncbi:hypothetical protein [Acinetobacter amyesii]|uniref:hypothetical protein n=1 Tax=Acinetobacter amyesii TaxID=2942470 RepID=UPI0020BE1F75|nr:hypothetical protein [Acinetobacter amyesii]MCL6231882.1 hypothetical protein [Acinetobacter amyesii]